MASSIVNINGKPISSKLLERFQEIDNQLSDQNSVIPVYWSEDAKQWKYRAGNWHEHLNIPNEYYAYKCQQKGVTDPDTLSRLSTWGSSMINIPMARSRKGNETYLQKPGKNLPDMPEDVRSDLENYTKLTRENEANSYQNCTLKYNSQDRQKDYEVSACQSVTCRMPTPIYIDEQVDHVPDSHPNKEKLVRCRNIGQLCKEVAAVSTFDFNKYRHIPNSGQGDCFFIAVARYLNMAKTLAKTTGMGRPISIDMDNNYYFPKKEDTDRAIPEDQLINITPEDKKLSGALRAMAVQWLTENPSHFIATDMIKYEIAKNVLENTPQIFTVKRHNEIIRHVANELEIDEADRQMLIMMLNAIVEDPPVEKESLVEDIVLYLNNAYLRQMSDIHTYAGQLEITALSNVLGVSIFAVQQADKDTLAANFGSLLQTHNDYMLVYLRRQVSGKGYNHYEIVFPKNYLKPVKEKETNTGSGTNAPKISARFATVIINILRICKFPLSKNIISDCQTCIEALDTNSLDAVKVVNTIVSNSGEIFNEIEQSEDLAAIYQTFTTLLCKVFLSMGQIAPKQLQLSIIMEYCSYLASHYIDDENGYGQRTHLTGMETYLKHAIIRIPEIQEIMSVDRSDITFEVLVRSMGGTELDFNNGPLKLWAESANPERDDRIIMRAYIEDILLPHLVLAQKYATTPLELPGLQVPLTPENIRTSIIKEFHFLVFNGGETDEDEEPGEDGEPSEDGEPGEEVDLQDIAPQHVELYIKLIEYEPDLASVLSNDVLEILAAISPEDATIDDQLTLIDQILEGSN